VPVEIVPASAEETEIAGLWRIDTKTITDERGTIREFFRTSSLAELGVPVPDRWSQINMTWTHTGGLRGLHGESMTKLVGVAAGTAFGVYLDARKESATYGKVVTMPLAVGVQALVPPGVCNGFQATSEGGCQYLYCFEAEWQPGMSGVAVNPLDPELAVPWPLPIDEGNYAQLSMKDASAPRFSAL
jgi:dTDP-4-dehydrorhamnose 3,5-epimerase